MQPYLEADIAICPAIKADVFSNWFKCRNSDNQTDQEDVIKEKKDMIELVNFVKKASKMDNFNPEEKHDLSTIMIGIFDTIIQVQQIAEDQNRDRSEVVLLFEKFKKGLDWNID